jgi:hypothetical protein
MLRLPARKSTGGQAPRKQLATARQKPFVRVLYLYLFVSNKIDFQSY